MVTLTLLYRATLEQVAELWLTSASKVGLRKIGAIPKANSGSWDTFRLRNSKIFFGIGESRTTEHVWAEVFSHGLGFFRHEEVFRKILHCHDSCSEIALLDDDAACSGPMLGFLNERPSSKRFLQALLQNYTAGTRQLRAIRVDQITDLDDWIEVAQGLELEPILSGNYLLLNIHWEERGRLTPDGVHAISLPAPYE
jgi:hypothetical protein